MTGWRPALVRVAPFAVWVALMTLLPATAGAYALRSLAAGAALCACLAVVGGGAVRRAVASGSAPRPLASALAAGALVAALWIFPERWEWYRSLLVWPVGAAAPDPATVAGSPYAPAACGWALTLAKLAGSAFVIAPAEELFFRSFLYRRLQRRDFTAVPHSAFDAGAFAITVLLFACEHNRFAAAAAAGVVYGAVYLRWGLFPAAVAHSLTNLLLGLHVVCRGEWGFW